MEANTTTASPVIPAASRISQGKTTEAVQNRGNQGDSSAAFSQRTNVSIETAIDHMADVLAKISGRRQMNVQQMPAELKEVIQNMMRQSFSIETTLGQGLGSTAASQRFSTDQLTTLARMLNQLGTMAEEGGSPQVSDDLAALLTGLKSALAKESGGTFEPIMLTKAAFQLLDTGNAELLPKELQTFLTQLNAQGTAVGTSGGAGSTSLSFLNQLVQLLMPRDASGTATAPPPTNVNMQGIGSSNATVPPADGQEARIASSAQNMNVPLLEDVLPEQQMAHTQMGTETEALAKNNTSAAARQATNMPEENVGKGADMAQQNVGKVTGESPAPSNPSPAQNAQTTSNETGSAQKAMVNELPENAQKNTMTEPTQTGMSADRGQNSAPSAGNINTNAQVGKEPTNPMAQQGDPGAAAENKTASEVGARTSSNVEVQPQSAKSAAQGEAAAQPTRSQTGAEAQPQPARSAPQGEATAQTARPKTGAEAELVNAAKSPPQSAAQMKSPEMQNVIPRFFTQTMENTPQTMNVLRNLAQSLLQNENLNPKETLLLQNFVSGRGQTLSEGDAKQLQQLIQLTRQNIPGTVRQAALEQQMPDLPRLWAFMQMADIVKTRRMTAEQYKRAGRDVAALALTMRNALEGENAAPQPGQRSMNFVMPLFMGASEYPAYIHVYDETKKDEETDLVKKETWLRICVLTDNIGTVELINRIYEENHVDMRLYFTDADAAWEFRNALDSIRETADGTSLVIEGIQIGAIGERRFFTN